MDCGGRGSNPLTLTNLMPLSSVGRASLSESEGSAVRSRERLPIMLQRVARGQGGHGPVCKTGIDGFNSRSRIQLAQWLEWTGIRILLGSMRVWDIGSSSPFQGDDVGSIPTARTNCSLPLMAGDLTFNQATTDRNRQGAPPYHARAWTRCCRRPSGEERSL